MHRQRRDSNASDDGDSSSHPWGHDRPALQDLQLTSYEQTIAMEVVAPEDIPVSFEDIGGLEGIIEELKENEEVSHAILNVALGQLKGLVN